MFACVRVNVENSRTKYSWLHGFHSLLCAAGLTVMIETDEPVSGTVTVSVDQSTPSHPVTLRPRA